MTPIAAGVVYWKREPHEYTASVTARVHGRLLSGLKFWAVTWKTRTRAAGCATSASPCKLLAPGVIVGPRR